MPAKVWKDPKGAMFHDECFDKGESRDGFDAVDMNTLDDDDVCESCGGAFVLGPADDDDGEEEDEEVETA